MSWFGYRPFPSEKPPKAQKPPLENPWRVKMTIRIKGNRLMEWWIDYADRPEDKWESFASFKKWYFNTKKSEFLMTTRDKDILIRRTDIAALEVSIINLEEDENEST